jgi:phage RecT family recombinase
MGTALTVIDQAFDDKALPSRFNGNRFDKGMKWAAEKEYARQIAVKSPMLLKCTPESIRTSMLEVAWSGMSLAPSQAHAYLIPYKVPDLDIVECTFKPGYRGLAWMSMQGGAVTDLNAARVFSHDKFRVYTENNRRIVEHEEDWKVINRGKVIAVWAIAKLASGGERVEVTPWEIIKAAEEAAKRMGGPKGGMAWKGDFRDQMELKVAIRRVLKMVPSDARGWLKHGLEVVDKHEGIDFAKLDAPIQSQHGEQQLCISAEQALELHALLTDRGLEAKQATSWLKNAADFYNVQRIEDLPVKYFEDAKQRLADRVAKAKR